MEESKQSDSGVAKQSDPEMESKILAAIAEGVSVTLLLLDIDAVFLT